MKWKRFCGTYGKQGNVCNRARICNQPVYSSHRVLANLILVSKQTNEDVFPLVELEKIYKLGTEVTDLTKSAQ